MPYSAELSPFNAPSHDVFAPARRSDALGVVLGTPLDGGQSYVPWIGVSTIRELALKHADKTKLVPVEILEHVREQLLATASQLAEANKRLEELEASQERISGLVKDGYKVQKVMGRPKEAKA